MGDEKRKRSIIDDVAMGDAIGLVLDRKFFLKSGDAMPELYAGFIISLTDRVISLSTSHNLNLSHGYDPFSEEKQKQGITKVGISHYIKDYFSLINKRQKGKKEIPPIEKIHIGDLVMLSLNGAFFRRKDDLPERYAGFVTQIQPGLIGISTTHHNNKSHGYVSLEEEQQKVITKISLVQVLNYNKIDYPKTQE
ncbi:hypothetical protein KY348_07630 [Candidatus Woesearchaeota archaeon]|nr:hypothetical protein [Candidatus Woesearchaeota archaeon]